MTERTDWLQDFHVALSTSDRTALAELLRDHSVDDLVDLLRQFQDRDSRTSSVSSEAAADVLEAVGVDTAREVLDKLPPDEAANVFDELEDDHASTLVQGMEPDKAAELLDDVPPEDAADVLENLPAEMARDVLSEMASDAAADVLEEMDDEAASDILESMVTGDAADLLEGLDPHEAADLLQEMHPESARAALAEMEPDDRSGVVELLAYPEDSAGGQMTKRYFALRENATVGRAVESLRRWAEERGSVYYAYVVDRDRRLVGVVALHSLVLASPDTPIREVLTADPITVPVGVDQEEVAQLFRKYHFLALPVVDEGKRLVGVITFDDAMQVIDEEATEDAHHMVGLPQDERVFSPVLQSVRRRIPWLFVNTLTALVAAHVVGLFKTSIAQVTALAVMMPIVAGQGGNFGTQTLTIIVRGLALGEVSRRGAWRALWKEVRVGLVAGLCVGAGAGLVGWLWQGNALLGLVLACAMVLNMVVAAIAGVAVPLGLRSVGIDPALASSIFVTMVTDSMGFFFFLGLATLVLKHLV
jgi:magnesium transporter